MFYWRNTNLSNRFFWALGCIALLYASAFGFAWLMPVAHVVLMLFIILLIVDFFLLFRIKSPVHAERKLPQVLSLHDHNEVIIQLHSLYPWTISTRIIDELPPQLQERNLLLRLRLPRQRDTGISYTVRPFKRGAYTFSHINIYLIGFFQLLERRLVVEQTETVKVYPSIIQMKKFELYTMKHIAFFEGMKKMRRIGHSYEFDQIKQYVQGDDIRSINWKNTGRTGTLMVNHYEDERAQQVYCLIDKSRNMKMPFDQLTLMDYAINTSLVISNIAIRKQDKAGIISFSSKVDTIIKADRHAGQMRKILDTLYNERERFNESSFEYLYQTIRQVIHVRSLLFLYTNFESYYAIERVMGILRKLNKLHLLVVVFFENEEIRQYGETPAKHTEDVYLTTFARKFVLEKQLIMQELNKYGIQTIITSPSQLTVHTINKYLELKSRGMI
jgi:uncharacterized protein (DUF58 family)